MYFIPKLETNFHLDLYLTINEDDLHDKGDFNFYMIFETENSGIDYRELDVRPLSLDDD